MVKRLLSVLLMLAILICCVPAIFATDDDTELIPWWDFQQGDVNLDTKISIKDVTLIQKYLAKLSTLSEPQLVLADIDGKEGVSIKDATHLQKWLAGLTNELFGGKETVPPTTESLAITTVNESESTFSKATQSTTEHPSESSPASEIKTSATEASSIITDPTESVNTTSAESEPASSLITDPIESEPLSSVLTDPAESTASTPAESEPASSTATDPTEVTLPSSEATESTEIAEATEASSTEAATSEAEKTEFTGIITLPFVPAV